MKIKTAVIFGGPEGSANFGIEAFLNLDRDKYDALPLYLTDKNELYTVKDISDIDAYKNTPGLLSRSRQVYIAAPSGRPVLIPCPRGCEYRNRIFDINVVLLALSGDDSAFRGYLKAIGVPFTGCDVLASAITGDKYISKLLFKENGLPVLEARQYTLSDYAEIDTLMDDIETSIGYPAIIKPVSFSAGAGINIANNRGALAWAVDDAFRHSAKILAERVIMESQEISCLVLGDETGVNVSGCKETPRSVAEREGGGESTEPVSGRVRDLAASAFGILGCQGAARFDFIIDKDGNEIYLNGVNTSLPSRSFTTDICGLSYTELLDKLIALAIKRTRLERNLANVS